MWVLFEGKELSPKDATQPRTASSIPSPKLTSIPNFPSNKMVGSLRYGDAVIYESLIIRNAARRPLARFE